MKITNLIIEKNPVSMELYTTPECVLGVEQNKDYSVYFLDNNVGAGIQTINRKLVVMNAGKVVIVTQIIQLVTNLFVAETHVQQNRRRELMGKRMAKPLPNLEEMISNGIPEAVPSYMKDHQPREGPPDLDDLLYRHVKQMI